MSSFTFKKNYSDTGIYQRNDSTGADKVILEEAVFNDFKERVISGSLRGEIRTDTLWRKLYPTFEQYCKRSSEIDPKNTALQITDTKFDTTTQELFVEVSPIGEFKEEIEKGFKEGTMSIGIRCFTSRHENHFRIERIITFDLVQPE